MKIGDFFTPSGSPWLLALSILLWVMIGHFLMGATFGGVARRHAAEQAQALELAQDKNARLREKVHQLQTRISLMKRLRRNDIDDGVQDMLEETALLLFNYVSPDALVITKEESDLLLRTPPVPPAVQKSP